VIVWEEDGESIKRIYFWKRLTF